jgi:hypothetical protein
MRNLLITLGALAAFGALLAGPAAAETDVFSGDATLTVTTAAAGQLQAKGPITSPGFGKGTLTYLVTVNPDGTTTAPFTAKFKFGSLTGTTKGNLIADPNGGNSLSGTGKITGGTRAYKNGKGKFTYTGHDHADGTDTLSLKGKVTFPTR